MSKSKWYSNLIKGAVHFFGETRSLNLLVEIYFSLCVNMEARNVFADVTKPLFKESDYALNISVEIPIELGSNKLSNVLFGVEMIS